MATWPVFREDLWSAHPHLALLVFHSPLSSCFMVDNLTPEQRSLTMSRIRGRDTKVELAVRRVFHKRGHRYRVNVPWLAGKPDVVFAKARLVIFIDGDFWHGWRFEQWSHKLATYWSESPLLLFAK